MNDNTFDLLIKKRDDAIEQARELLNKARLYSAAATTLDAEDERVFVEEQHNLLVRALKTVDIVMDDEFE